MTDEQSFVFQMSLEKSVFKSKTGAKQVLSCTLNSEYTE